MKICKNITCKIFPFDQKWPARMVTVKVANSEVIEFLFKLERTDRSLKVFHPVFRRSRVTNNLDPILMVMMKLQQS